MDRLHLPKDPQLLLEPLHWSWMKLMRAAQTMDRLHSPKDPRLHLQPLHWNWSLKLMQVLLVPLHWSWSLKLMQGSPSP